MNLTPLTIASHSPWMHAHRPLCTKCPPFELYNKKKTCVIDTYVHSTLSSGCPPNLDMLM